MADGKNKRKDKCYDGIVSKVAAVRESTGQGSDGAVDDEQSTCTIMQCTERCTSPPMLRLDGL